jgi:tetratricopeptide (TPR) repeat protein
MFKSAMRSGRSFLRRLNGGKMAGLLALSVMLAGAGVFVANPAAMAQSDAAIGGSVLITKHANKAADYWNQGDYQRARDEFNKCISYDPKSVDYYEGVMYCCENTHEWSQVAGALEKMFSVAPEKKKFYEYDYGMALYNLNRYEEAIPHLKAALATADIQPPPFKPLSVKLDDSGSGADIPKIAAIPEGSRPLTGIGSTGSAPPTANKGSSILKEDEAGVVSGSEVDKMERELRTYDNAIRSETIVIAEYKGYDKTDDIRWNSPPKANFHITKFLIGPPLARELPVRFAFHTPAQSDPPPGWKFDESKMPAKDSKWIMFIEFAVPERGQFNTYLGSYGRQEATDKNLDLLDKVMDSHNMKFLMDKH